LRMLVSSVIGGLGTVVGVTSSAPNR
jgi:hypothetical protein